MDAKIIQFLILQSFTGFSSWELNNIFEFFKNKIIDEQASFSNYSRL